VSGVKNENKKKISGKNLTNPGTFLASGEPTNRAKARRFFGLRAPWLGKGRPEKKCMGMGVLGVGRSVFWPILLRVIPRPQAAGHLACLEGTSTPVWLCDAANRTGSS